MYRNKVLDVIEETEQTEATSRNFLREVIRKNAKIGERMDTDNSHTVSAFSRIKFAPRPQQDGRMQRSKLKICLKKWSPEASDSMHVNGIDGFEYTGALPFGPRNKIQYVLAENSFRENVRFPNGTLNNIVYSLLLGLGSCRTSRDVNNLFNGNYN